MAGLIETEVVEPQPAYYPAPRLLIDIIFHSCDWTVRYLSGGVKVFAFRTIDLQPHALWQTIGKDKTTASVKAHSLEDWSWIGLPDLLQIDNDSAFTGLGKQGRTFGSFVRLALYLGIELIFIPPGEANCNYVVEGVHYLWNASFWDKNNFSCFAQVMSKRKKFLAWYQDYEPPALAGLSVKLSSAGQAVTRLSQTQITAIPDELPLTAGRIHFIRRVSQQGGIEILKERWRAPIRLAKSMSGQ